MPRKTLILPKEQITPCLLFSGKAAEAARYYVKIFKRSKITHSGELVTTFTLDGQAFMALNGPKAKFTWAVSFMVRCPDQREVDRLWSRLTAAGKPGRCGWLEDKYGVSWQIVPDGLEEVLGDPDETKSSRAFQAMMGMTKLNLAQLKRAHAGK